MWSLQGWSTFFAIDHFWSLAVEEQFYLLWPLFVFVLGRKTLVLVCLLIITGSIGLRIGLHLSGNLIGAYILTPARMDALAIGSLIALGVRAPNGITSLFRWRAPRAVLAAAPLVGSVIIQHRLDSEHFVMQTIGYTSLALCFGELLLVAIKAAPTSLHGRFWTHPLLVMFGKYSYGLYVFHHLIVLVLRYLGISTVVFPSLLGSQVSGQVLFFVTALALSLGASSLSWHLIERPILVLKDRFPYHMAPDVGAHESREARWTL